MQELIKKLTETVGISEAQAIQSIETITGFIKEKLPPMMHGMVDSFLGQQTKTDGNNGINDLLGGLMGGTTEEGI